MHFHLLERYNNLIYENPRIYIISNSHLKYTFHTIDTLPSQSNAETQVSAIPIINFKSNEAIYGSQRFKKVNKLQT